MSPFIPKTPPLSFSDRFPKTRITLGKRLFIEAFDVIPEASPYSQILEDGGRLSVSYQTLSGVGESLGMFTYSVSFLLQSVTKSPPRARARPGFGASQKCYGMFHKMKHSKNKHFSL